MKKEIKVLQGNEAIVEGALAAGCRFFAGYPITPSTETAERFSERIPYVGGVFIPELLAEQSLLRDALNLFPSGVKSIEDIIAQLAEGRSQYVPASAMRIPAGTGIATRGQIGDVDVVLAFTPYTF